MKLYGFDEVGEDLALLPLAARRALDHAGSKLALEAWRRLTLDARRRVAGLGSQREVDADAVRAELTSASPAPATFPSLADPDPERPPPEVEAALGASRPLSDRLWATLEPIDRWALAKVAARGSPARIDAAYREIVGQSAVSTHLAPAGGVRMVDVSSKVESRRRAVAESRVTMSAEALARLTHADGPKGDVIGTARLAGILAAKRTAELIPLCHPLPLTSVSVELEPQSSETCVNVRATVETVGRTGVEMEALVAASVAALTVYDMLKSIDRTMSIGPTQLVEKSGGRSGDFRR